MENCKHAMDCNIEGCEKKHRISMKERIKLNQLLKEYKETYTFELESKENRFQKCSFGPICNNPTCGYYHRGLPPKVREDFKNFYEDLKNEKEVVVKKEVIKKSTSDVPVSLAHFEEKFSEVSQEQTKTTENFISYLIIKYPNMENCDIEFLKKMTKLSI